MQFEDGVDLNVSQANVLDARRTCYSIFLVVELDAANGSFFSANEDAHRSILKKLKQILTCIRAAGRSADYLDDVVDVIKRDLIAEQYVFALFGLAQVVLRAPTQNFHTMLDK